MWDSFSFSTSSESATNCLLLDTEVMLAFDTPRAIPINFLFTLTTISYKQNDEY